VHYFIENFAGRLTQVFFVATITIVSASLLARAAPVGERARRFAQVCFVGSAVSAAVATTTGLGDGGGFVWGLGDGSLDQWSKDLSRFPDTIQSVLLVGNVVLYVPVGLFAALGWPRSRWMLLGVCLLIPITVESLQPVALRGVGSTDDVVLNAIGVAIGWLAGAGVTVVRALRSERNVWLSPNLDT
jgi:hypothetical protein